MASRKMSIRKQSDADKKTRVNVTDKIPAFSIAGAKRNKNMVKIQQDLVERSRSNEKNGKEGTKMETLYVDSTRNVGVVLGNKCFISFLLNQSINFPGEKDIKKDMKKQAFLDKRSVSLSIKYIQ